MKQLLILNETIADIKKASDVFKNIKKINIDYTQENFILICLNSKNNIIKSEILFKGGLTSCIVCPKILFRKALINNSNAIIVAHNHPSNDLTPSDEDRKVYNKLKIIGNELNLKVLDNIIFNEKEFYAFSDSE